MQSMYSAHRRFDLKHVRLQNERVWLCVVLRKAYFVQRVI